MINDLGGRDRRARPFQLMVDSGSRDEPPTRYFGSLTAALVALAALPESFRRFASVTELDRGDGGNVVHVRDGRLTARADEGGAP